MSPSESQQVRAELDELTRLRGRVGAASRWFAGYLLGLGLASIPWTVGFEAYFPDGAARNYVISAGWLGVVLVTWWAGRRYRMYPEGASRRLTVAAAVWFGCYLLIVGPLVRWQFGTSPAWWAGAAAVLAVPFFVTAWLEYRRS